MVILITRVSNMPLKLDLLNEDTVFSGIDRNVFTLSETNKSKCTKKRNDCGSPKTN